MPIYAGAAGVTGFVRLELKVYDQAGALADPDDVQVTITLPDGTTTDASSSVVTTGTGLYYLDYEPSQVGQYGVYWVTTGVNAGTLEETFSVEDLTVFPPVSLSEVKAHLNIAADRITDDDELRGFINAATSAIEQRVGPLTRRTVTETHDGGGVVMLRTYPVITLTTVTDNGITLTAGQYRERDGIVTRKSGTSAVNFTTGLDGVSVTYEAGRTVIPADLRQAVLEQIRHMWETQRGQQRGRRDGDTFVAGQGYTFSNRVLQLIGPFELPSIA